MTKPVAADASRRPKRRRLEQMHEPQMWVAVIGDMVASRRLEGEVRRAAQAKFGRLMEELNEEFGDHIAGRFAITQGDEFEGLLQPESAADWLPTLIWRLEEKFPFPALRLGIGLGGVDSELREPPGSAITLDGAAFHRAREAVVSAAKERQMGGVFLGFGAGYDGILNGLARLLYRQRQRWSVRQREVALLLHLGLKQVEVARKMNRSPQAVSIDAHAAGWSAYVEGERAFRLAIQDAVKTNQA